MMYFLLRQLQHCVIVLINLRAALSDGSTLGGALCDNPSIKEESQKLTFQLRESPLLLFI